MANEMRWSVQSGYLTNNDLNKAFQRVAQPLMRFRQFTKFKTAFGAHKGSSQNWLKVSNAGSYGGKLTETKTMHEANQPITLGTASVDEYGLSIPLTQKVQTLSEFDVKSIVRESLLNDAVKVIDGDIERQFNATLLRYVATASASAAVFSTNGTTTKTNTSGMNLYHIRKMVLKLKQRNVPGFTSMGGGYSCIASHECLDSLSANMESVNQYVESGAAKIANGEVGRVHGVSFIEDGWATRVNFNSTTRLAVTNAAGAGGSYPGGYWTKAKSGAAYLFGSPTVREIVTTPEEIRAKVVTDYGRSHGLAWYGMFGWKIEWDTSGGADSRIIKWDSNA